MLDRLRTEDRGATTLEKLGLVSIVIVVLSFIPMTRHLMGDAYDATFGSSVLAKGILITVVSVLAFNGTGYLILSTNVGKRLAFLIGGAATFGWMTIGGLIFVIYAPRGLRPADLSGLNSFEIRIPSIALTLASLVLFLMFVAALDRYEKESAD